MTRKTLLTVCSGFILLLAGVSVGLTQDAAEPALLNPQPVAAVPPAHVDAGQKRLKDYGLKGLEEKVTLDTFTPWDVAQLLEYLAHKGHLNNIVIGKDVAGLTTKIKFKDITVGDALEVVLSVNSLAYEVKEDIITIMTDENYIRLNGRSFYDQKKVKVVSLKYADPARILPMLEKVKSSIGTVMADPITGNFIMVDTPEKIAELERVIAKEDIETIARVLPTETKAFKLQYAKVEDLQAQVTPMLSAEAGKMQVDARTRTLLVTDLPHRIKRIEEMVTLFDHKPKQVFIEAKVIEVGLSDDFSLGINWKHVFQGLDPRFALESVSQPGAPSVPALSLSYNTIVGGGDLEVVFEALKKVGDTKILSNPQIAVLDGQEAKIEVVENQPYKETTIESGTTNVTGVKYLFEKVGVQLSVTPRINDDNFINVAIKPVISSISQWYDGAPQEGTPVVRRAEAETTVLVKDGVTLIIGGLIKDRRDTGKTSVPILGKIPLLGRFFAYDSDSTANTETVVFLTPRIITGEEPFLRMKDIKKTPKPLRSVGVDETKQMKPVR